jgi:hypothetical protein
MRTAFALTICLAAISYGPVAFAQSSSSTATVQTTSEVDTPASISVAQNLNFNVSPQALTTGLVVTSSPANGINANVQLGGAVGDVVSVSVPTSITVVRDGGGETVTIRTVGAVSNVNNAAGAVPVTGAVSGGLFGAGPVTVIGLQDSGVLSFSVGGQVTVANNLVPGDYHGVLTVVAQYN